MKCHDIEERLTSYLDGNLPSGEYEEVARHLEDCKGCRALAGKMESTLDLLRRAMAADTSAPARLPNEAREQVHSSPRPSGSWITMPAPEFLSKVAALLVLSGIVAMIALPSFKKASRKDSFEMARLPHAGDVYYSNHGTYLRSDDPVDTTVLLARGTAVDADDDGDFELGDQDEAGFKYADPTSAPGPTPEIHGNAPVYSVEVVGFQKAYGGKSLRVIDLPKNFRPDSKPADKDLLGEGLSAPSGEVNVSNYEHYQRSVNDDLSSERVVDTAPEIYAWDRTSTSDQKTHDLHYYSQSNSDPTPDFNGKPKTGAPPMEIALNTLPGNRPSATARQTQPSLPSPVANPSDKILIDAGDWTDNQFSNEKDNRYNTAWFEGRESERLSTRYSQELDRTAAASPASTEPPPPPLVTETENFRYRSKKMNGSDLDQAEGGSSSTYEFALQNAEGIKESNGRRMIPSSNTEGQIAAQGDTLSSQAWTFGTTVNDLNENNPLSDPNSMAVGQTLHKNGTETGAGEKLKEFSADYSKNSISDHEVAKEKREELNKELAEARTMDLALTESSAIISNDGQEGDAREKMSTGFVTRASGINPYVAAEQSPFSTFSVDTDTASYTLTRRHILDGFLPPAEAVRTEEFVNFFDYHYSPPALKIFAIYCTYAPVPFGPGHFLKIGVKGKNLGREEEKAAMLTFVIDTSGSMNTPDRLGLVKTSLKLLVNKLGERDRVAIVQYGSKARLLLDHTPLTEKAKILQIIETLQPTGSTHLEEGLKLGYKVAADGFVGGAINRVLLLSDGVANLGSASAEGILSSVERYRDLGIYSSVFGFGVGTYNDEMLETLANKGDGVYQFIDSAAEARRVFVDELAANLNVIAKNVKIQVEFDPKRVTQYRQLGYENRQLKKEEFRDNTVDAGEIGSGGPSGGQSVTALYELQLHGDKELPLGIVRIRYENVQTGEIEEQRRTITAADFRPRYEQTDPGFKLAVCVAEFAELLRGSPYSAGSDYEDVARELRPVAQEQTLDKRVQELLQMVTAARNLPRAGNQ